MAIAFSGQPIVYSSLRADTSANLRADLHAAVTGAGWAVTSTLTNGYAYTLTSPQGLACKCRIQDAGSSIPFGLFAVDVQFSSVDGARQGVTHLLPFGGTAVSTHTYVAHAGVCQLFVKMPGVVNTPMDGVQTYDVSGGVPYVPPNILLAGAGSNRVTELWWSSGGDLGGGMTSLRSSRYCNRYYSACKNGTLHTTTSTNESYIDSPLQLLSLTPTLNTDFWYPIQPLVHRWAAVYPGTPLNIDALLIYQRQLFGQLWDAFCKSKFETTIDLTITTTETNTLGAPVTVTWEAYGHSDATVTTPGAPETYYNTLYLAKGIPAGAALANYAY